MDALKAIESAQLSQDISEFKIGDTVKVHYRIIEGRAERVQIFEGLCIAMRGDGLRKKP